jgi:hypothetical protein
MKRTKIMLTALAAIAGAGSIPSAGGHQTGILESYYWYSDLNMTNLSGYFIIYCDGRRVRSGSIDVYEDAYFGTC